MSTRPDISEPLAEIFRRLALDPTLVRVLSIEPKRVVVQLYATVYGRKQIDERSGAPKVYVLEIETEPFPKAPPA